MRADGGTNDPTCPGFLEAVDFDGLLVETQAVVLVREELLDLVALITLELDHVSHALGVGVVDDGAIASEFLLDDLEDLLVVKLLGNALDSRQCLTTITLLNADMDVGFLGLLGLSCVLVGVGEGIDGLEIFDGHKLWFFGVTLGEVVLDGGERQRPTYVSLKFDPGLLLWLKTESCVD